jgi:hypothetical protein
LDRKAVVQLPRSDRRLSAYVEEGQPARLLAGALGAVERAGLVLGDHPSSLVTGVLICNLVELNSDLVFLREPGSHEPLPTEPCIVDP